MPLQGDNRGDGGLDIISSTLLRTNHQCNSTQVRSVKMMIAQKTDNIKAIDYDILSIQFKINKLMNSMKTLKNLRFQEKKEFDCCKYILSSIRLLPPEILTKIFKYTVTVFRPSHRSESPLALAHVCSTWRDAVFGCSYFWNQLELFVAPHTKASPGFSERVALWYGHSSSSQPLRLSVRIDGTPEDLDVLADLSQSITAFSPRLVKLSLKFMFKNYDALAPFLCLPPDSLAALESLCLLAPEADGDTPILLPPTHVFAAAPCLRTLYLSIPSHLLTDPTRLRLPWTQLTRLEIANTITLSAFTHVLFQCAPHLRSARFACVDDRFDPETPRLPSAPQIFPCLEHLHLSVTWTGPHPGLLSILDVLLLLRLPNLRTLEVRGDHDLFPMYALLPILAEPGGTAEGRALRLTEIVLCQVQIEAAELVGFLGRCTRVAKLNLFVRNVSSNEILRRMKKMVHLLRLREFRFAFAPEDTEGQDMRGVAKDFGALVAESTKCGGGRRLRKATLYVFSHFNNPNKKVLRAMVKDVRAATLFGDAEPDVGAHDDNRVSARVALELRPNVTVEWKTYLHQVAEIFGFD